MIELAVAWASGWASFILLLASLVMWVFER